MDRCDVIAGDFFSGVPQGADAYLLKRILHDWDDEAAIRILRRCREAMSDSSRVLAIDAVMQSGNALDPNKDMDISIMALTRGRERTEQDFRAIYRQAGLRCSRVVAPEPPAIVSIVEGVLV
jgi:hypothetical protein